MPEKKEAILVDGYDANAVQTNAYGALEQLGWTIKYITDDIIIAYTPKSWNKFADEIVIETKANELTITSKLVNGESFDISNKNKKHIAAFLAAFETTKNNNTEEQKNDWTGKIASLKESTNLQIQQDVNNAQEVDRVMKLSTSNLFVTYGIVAINLLVFIVMIASGVHFISPTGEDIVKWGGNYGPLTGSGEWWRLISCVFVHIGIVHVLFNMYALFTVGVYLEPMLGKIKYIVAYLCTGVFASLISLWWHKEPVASAGASGAIFGMYGIFLALLSTNLIPKQVRNQLLQSILIFVVYNLVYGMKSGVDNAAHLGGLASGLMIGYLYYFQLKRKEASNSVLQSILIIAATVLIAFLFLRPTKVVHTKGDAEKFAGTMEHFDILEEIAREAMVPADTATKEQFLEQLKKTSLPNWVDCVNLCDEAKKLKLGPTAETERSYMEQYAKNRLQQTLLYIKSVEEDSDKYRSGIDSIQQNINEIIEKRNGKNNVRTGEREL